MKKAIYYSIRDVRVEDVPEPQPGAGEVKVKVKYCGICGSDLHEYLHGPFPESPFGHEACGEIVALGPDMHALNLGDRVCTLVHGSYAEYVVCPVDRLIRIPDHISWERAALIEPLSGAAYAIERGKVHTEDTVFIAGCGTVGLMLLLGLKAMGVRCVYMTDISSFRREMAIRLGATEVWDPREVKVPNRIKELTQGKGVDVSIEAVGVESTLKDCLASVRMRGTVIVQGIFTERALIHMLGFVTRETTMIGTNSINPTLALNWLNLSNIAPEAVVTDIVPLDEIVSHGFEVLAARREGTIKVLISPSP